MAIRLELTSVIALCTVVGAATFALGRGSSPTSGTVPPGTQVEQAVSNTHEPPPGHPATGTELPPNHPPIDAVVPAAPSAPPDGVELAWVAPSRWQSVPNASSMRLASYKIPRVKGDSDDAELSVMQAGGSVDANIERWVGQFGEDGKRTLRRSKERIAGLDVILVQLQGTFSGGMAKDARPIPDAALLGAIVVTPGSAHFFKMTGPARTVLAANDELHQLVASLTLK